MSKKRRELELGIDSNISRRDFLNGVAITIGATMLPSADLLAQASGPDSSAQEYFLSRGITQQNPEYYPPALTGMRGSHPGSFESAHALRDGNPLEQAIDTKEHYDLIVVGGGISGLAAAYFYKKSTGPKARILILDNHDDFGGHAKRNEFRAGNRLLLGYGGTQSIEAPGRYSKESIGLLKELGIDVQRFYKYYDQKLYASMHLKSGTFFDKETFGEDKLLQGPGEGYDVNTFVPVPAVAQMPIAEQARKDLIRLNQESIDYLPDLSPEQKRAKLATTSYKDYLLQNAKVHPDVAKLYQTLPHDLFCVGIDAVSAATCRGMGYPGFKGMEIASLRHREEAEGGAGEEEPYIFHFPDGNASVARLLVRSLVPGSAPGSTMEDIVTAKMNYATLDRASSPVRIRLNSTAVHVKNVGEPSTARDVEVTYTLAGNLYKVRGASSVLACYNCIVPYLCPEMSETQKEALSYAVKQPLVYVNIQIRNWKAFQNLGVSGIYSPGSYFSSTVLDFPVSIGSYKFPSSPEEPCVVHLLRTPCKPGLTAKEQFKAGRSELLITPYETFERKIREQLGRMLGAGGFDPAGDIQAITVNRWPHGYAYEYNPLFEPQDRPPSERPCVLGRKPFGRISIANSDSDGHAYTNTAIDQAYRAVQEIISSNKAASENA